MNAFASRLQKWFTSHGRRDLPWQQNPTPYRVWVSEIMLQQTRVATVIPYYLRFMESFPDANALADANIDDVLHHWSGLGYYARARNLHQAAKDVRGRFGGEFPASFDDVVALPGIGRSTAGAILSLSRGERQPILDGNVKRVLSRYHAVAGWPGKTAVARQLWQYADEHTPTNNVAAYTQAIMDLGATVCRRTRPRCSDCPLAAGCAAHEMGREAEYPGRREKKPKPLKRTRMIMVHADECVYLERRPASGIWGGLWSFPELEPQQSVASWCEQNLHATPVDMQEWQTVRHSFTHFDLDIVPVVISVQGIAEKVADEDDRRWHQLDAPLKAGMAAPVSDLLARLTSNTTTP